MGRNSQPHRKVLETHRVLKCTQTHPLGNQHQKGPICLWLAAEVTESWQSGASSTVPSQTPPPLTASQCHHVLPHPGEHLRLSPLLCNRCTERKKKPMAHMKEQIKAPEKIQLSNKGIQPIKCTVQNTSNQDAHRIG